MLAKLAGHQIEVNDSIRLENLMHNELVDQIGEKDVIVTVNSVKGLDKFDVVVYSNKFDVLRNEEHAQAIDSMQ